MTDKYRNYYEGVSIEQFANAVQLLDDATRYDNDMLLNNMELVALARILAYEGINGDGGHFAHAVDFLWMANRISTASKLMLLELMDDSHLRDKLNDGTQKEETHEQGNTDRQPGE